MADNSQHVRKSINFKAQPDDSDVGARDLAVDGSDSDRLVYNAGSGAERVVLQSDIDATNTSISNHISDTSDAHDASAISFSPVSDIVATDVQAAIAEVNSDLNTAESSLSSHITAIEAHGAEGEVVGTTNEQTLTNKTLLVPVLSSPTVEEYILADDATNLTILGGATNRNIIIQAQGSGDVNLVTDTGQVTANGADVVTTTGTQTLTNKTLTSPTINTPTGIVKGDVGLGNVDNTSDANKPVSTATQTALNLKADLASPALTGTPTAPTAAPGTNTTQIATTAFVSSAVGAAGSSLVLLQTQTASSSATIDFTSGIDSTYDEYRITISGLVAATNAVDFWCRVQTGGSWSTSANYTWHWMLLSASTAPATIYVGGDTKHILLGSQSNSASFGHTFEFTFYKPSSTTFLKNFMWNGVGVNSSSAIQYCTGGGIWNVTSAITGIRFLMSSGNIATGTFSLYGVVK